MLRYKHCFQGKYIFFLLPRKYSKYVILKSIKKGNLKNFGQRRQSRKIWKFSKTDKTRTQSQ